MAKMSFNWSRYLSLAQQLYSNSNGDEAFLRSAISRAYYAAFVTARNHLRDKDRIRNIPVIDAHNFVITQFELSQNPLRNRIGVKLRNLRKWRNFADYEDRMFQLNYRTRTAITSAQEVLNDLQSL
jgi:uncharacterized protein (UPF0332 family)